MSIAVRRTALAKRPPGAGRAEAFADWNDGRPETELNFKFYRQATNKIVGISDEAAAYLRGFFSRAGGEMTAIWRIERIRKTDRGYLSEPE